MGTRDAGREAAEPQNPLLNAEVETLIAEVALRVADRSLRHCVIAE